MSSRISATMLRHIMTKRTRALVLIAAAFTIAGTSAAAPQESAVREQIASWVTNLPALWPSGEMAQRSGTIVLRFSGPGGGVWHARLAQGQLTTGQGEVDDPTAVVECAASDWLEVLGGRLGAVDAFVTGKMRVSGDLDFVREFYAHLLAAPGGAQQVTTDVSGWYPFEPLAQDYTIAVAPDASHLLDAPAGKHGFLTARGDRFVFEDGTPARFWGTNLVSGYLFSDHETARRTAARLARFGCNMVRFHGADIDTIFDPAHDDTQHLSPDALDRLDYLIYQLKRRGIYVNLGLLVFRHFRAGDGVPEWEQLADRFIQGAKIAAHFDTRLIELQKKYAHDLYTHVNKYTGLRYRDDPAIAMSEIINESSLFWLGAYENLPPTYLAEINQRYRRWARGRGITVAQSFSVPQGLRQRDAQVLRFLYETQAAYFTEMRDYLRSIGVKVPLAGSNFWEPIPLDIRSNLVLDYVDRHGYWDHPQAGFGPAAGFDNQPMVKARAWNLVTWLAGQQVANRPIMISEWNCAWINQYIAEGPLTIAAYGAFQGWDGLLTYCFASPEWPDQVTDNFNVGSWPHVFSTWPAAARLFLQGHVGPGAPLLLRRPPWQIDPIGPDLPDRAGERRRLVFDFAARAGKTDMPDLPPLEGPAATDTGQLTWDSDRGLITVNAPASAARIGFASEPIRAGAVTFDLAPGFAVAALTALDDQPLDRSEHLLLTVTARAENTGMIYAPGKKKALDAGRAPILIEPVRGEVRVALHAPVAAVEVYSLDSIGRRRAAVAASVEADSLIIPLQADAFWYEVVVAR